MICRTKKTNTGLISLKDEIKNQGYDENLQKVLIYKATLPIIWNPDTCLYCETVLIQAELIKRKCLSCHSYLKSELEPYKKIIEIRHSHGLFTPEAAVSMPILICFESYLNPTGWTITMFGNSVKLFSL